MRKTFIPLLLSVLVVFNSCKKEMKDPGGGIPNPGGGGTNQQTVKSTIKLLVVNENNMLVSHAKVQVGSTIAYTNQFGFVEFPNITVPLNRAVAKVSLPGYFDAYRSFAIDKNECFGKIKLHKYQFAGTVSSATGGEVEIGTEVKINFPANSFTDLNGVDYNGTAVIYAQYLNPESPDFSILQPGDLVADNTGYDILKSFGMLNVEIQGNPNQFLKLKPNIKATITAAIPPSLVASSPASLPMWYFDTQKGIWIKEGTGTKQGTNYKGDVSHFTWWNFDYAYPMVFISAKLYDPSGIPLVNTSIRMTGPDGVTAFGYTNDEGYFRVPAPLNSPCNISAYGPGCNIPFFSMPVNTVTTDIYLGNITANTLTQNRFNVKGNFTNCTGQPVIAGSLKIFAQNNMFEGRVINGLADLSFNFCSDFVDVLIYAEDSLTNKIYTTSRRLFKDVTADLGTLSICGSVDQKFIRYIVDNQLYYITGNSIDSLTSHYFNFGSPWVQVAHNNWSNPTNLTTKIYFNTDIGGYVTTCIITDYPNLSNLGSNRQLTNVFENYSPVPGTIIKGIMYGRQFDTGINQWRYIDVAYSVQQQ